MALVNLVGAGIWLPVMPNGYTQTTFAVSDIATLDADEEEFQVIGTVTIDGGASKTFGTSGSKVGWLPGNTLTFASGSTLRVGVKKASTLDKTAGPPARATIGAAAFDVYKDLVGGTDTLTNLTWLDTTMAAGTPFTVADGDELAICFHLDTSSGTPSVKVRQSTATTGLGLPTATHITSGPTYTERATLSNIILVFDDGTLGWISITHPFSVAEAQTATIGNGNTVANIFQIPFSCKVDAIAALVRFDTNTNDFALELYGTPLGTPALIGPSLAADANLYGALAVSKLCIRRYPTPQTLSINTDYAVGIKQTTAGIVLGYQRDVNEAAHFKAGGMGAECYAANSAAGATFAAQNSGKRRYHIWLRVSALDNGVGGGSGGGPLVSARLIK